MPHEKPQSQYFVDVLQWLGSVAAAGELRAEPRIQVQAPVTLRHAGGTTAAETRDMTPSGVCVVAPWDPEVGEEFTLDLPRGSGEPAPVESSAAAAYYALRCVVRYRTSIGANRVQIGASFVGRVD